MILESHVIYELVRSTKLFKELTQVESPKLGVLLACKGIVNTKFGEFELGITFSNTFPYSKPNIKLLNKTISHSILHINAEGTICYIDDTNYVVDFNNPYGIINESLNRVINILEVDSEQIQKKDFIAEFNSYWQEYLGAKRCLSIIPIINNISRVTCCITPQNTILGKDKIEINEYLNRTDQRYAPRTLNWQSAVYISLPKGKEFFLPKRKRFWTKEQVINFVKKNIGAWEFSKFKRIFFSDRLQPIIFNLPMKGEDSVLFGVYFKNMKKGIKASPLLIERLDKEFAFPRAGAKNSIHGKKITIIGCGAIGGYVAVNLSQLGIGELTLVDPQEYSTSNVHRHVLGVKEQIFFPKVKGLKKEIEGKFIHTNVNAIKDYIESYILKGNDTFKNIDLVIIATGNPSTNFWLNNYLLHKHPNLPTVYSWVDPLGIGGHTLVTNNSQKKGCYQCLYKSYPNVGMYNMASFADKGQSFLKTQSGCAGMFVPYSSLDAQQTSIQTVRIAIKILEGIVKENLLISWKGDSKEFLSNRFRLSSRYNLSKEELWERRNQYLNPKCSTCGKKTKRLSIDELKAGE